MVKRSPKNLEPTSSPRVSICLRSSIWGMDIDETTWAEHLGEDQAQLKNVPFYAYGLSFDDVLRLDDVNAIEVTARSGHSTYRIFVQKGQIGRAFGSYWKNLEDLGCTYERATEHLFAIDVPPKSDIHAVYRALQAGEEDGIWEFEEGHCQHTS